MPSSYHSSIIVILSLGVYQQVLLRDCNIYKTQLRKSSARHNITPVLQQLHWLPVQSRIDFKTLILNQRGGDLFLITGLSYGTHYLHSLGMLLPWIVLRNFLRRIFLVKLLICDYLLGFYFDIMSFWLICYFVCTCCSALSLRTQ